MKVRWRSRARADLHRILDHIREHSPSGADYVGRRIKERTRQLRRFPWIGRPGRAEGIRELVVGGTPYIVVYRITVDDEVEVVSIFHTAQER